MDESMGLRHRRAWDLIPWVVNGSASAEERQVVGAHVAVCEDCRAELAFQQRVHGAMADAGPAPAAEPALQRFWARADALEAAAPAVPPRRTAGGGRWTRVLAAAVVVQAVGLAALAGMLIERPRPAAYETLSRPAPAAPAATLRVVPAPTLTLAELQAVLARSGVELVDTSADGAILGAALRPQSGLTAEQALQRLRAEPGVRLAEPIVAGR